MLKLTNTIVGKEYVTPRDALLSMISTHRLETDSCYDPDPNAVTDILAHAVSTVISFTFAGIKPCTECMNEIFVWAYIRIL